MEVIMLQLYQLPLLHRGPSNQDNLQEHIKTELNSDQIFYNLI